MINKFFKLLVFYLLLLNLLFVKRILQVLTYNVGKIDISKMNDPLPNEWFFVFSIVGVLLLIFMKEK